MIVRVYAALALSFTLLSAGFAEAKTTAPVHHAKRHAAHRSVDVRYAQGFYDYRAAGAVHEAFRDSRGGDWYRDRHFHGRDFRAQEFYGERRGGMVVENLSSGDFSGGVGYGLNGDVPSFVDGFGQTHFFVGNFRRMAPVPGRFGAPHFGGPRGGFHGGFR